MIFEIKKMGFNNIELSFNLTEDMVQDTQKLVQAKEINVLSLHNFCPIPAGMERADALPDCFAMSSLDEIKREAAINHTKRTIDSAKTLGAGVVVLHCGRVEIPDRTRELIRIYDSGAKNTLGFTELREELKEKRQRHAEDHFENTLKSLAVLNSYAEEKGIKLGVETRFYYHEIPSFEEMGVILKKFEGTNIFFWHDTGHGQVQENLGFAKHQDYLDSYGKYLVGIHIHDIMGCQDHLSPLRGTFDFSLIKGYLNNDTIKIMEVHYPANPENIKAGKKYLETLFA